MEPTFDLDFSVDMDKIMDELCEVETLIELDLSLPSDNDIEQQFYDNLLKHGKNKPLF